MTNDRNARTFLTVTAMAVLLIALTPWVKSATVSKIAPSETEAQERPGVTLPVASVLPDRVVPGGRLGSFLHGTYPSKGNRTHVGIDIAAPCGARVYPFLDGTVVDAIASPNDPNFDSLGYMVIVEHKTAEKVPPFYTLYLHL